MISPEQIAAIRRLFFAEHWKIGTIAAELKLHPDTIRRALETERFQSRSQAPLLTDPFLDFIGQTLTQHPRLRATRLLEMLRDRGFQGTIHQIRRVVRALRPVSKEAFLRLSVLPGEQGQVDWASFGEVTIGRARRRLSCFVLTLSHSRAFYLEFFFDQSLENFLQGHVNAFADLAGAPRSLLYDNLKSAVLERHGDAIRFHPRLLELCGHYHYAARPCNPRRGNEKGRVERTIRYVRDSFFAARPFSTLEILNRQALDWRDRVTLERRWPGDDSRTVGEVYAEEKLRLLPLPSHPFETALIKPVRSGKTIYIHFDLNDYSIPHTMVGRALTLAASPTVVRLLDGTAEIARHTRSYDRHQRIDDPSHTAALLEEKRKALGATAAGQLSHAIPNIEKFLDAAFGRGESPARQTTQLLKLLEDYGAQALAAAVAEA
ncbi:MAG TPA: IS21 family transposase, partial [Blastocatellia bacterium]